MYRWAITFSCRPSLHLTYGSNAPTQLTAYHEVKLLVRSSIPKGSLYMIEIDDVLFDQCRRFGSPGDRFEFVDVPDPYYPTRRAS